MVTPSDNSSPIQAEAGATPPPRPTLGPALKWLFVGWIVFLAVVLAVFILRQDAEYDEALYGKAQRDLQSLNRGLKKFYNDRGFYPEWSADEYSANGGFSPLPGAPVVPSIRVGRDPALHEDPRTPHLTTPVRYLGKYSEDPFSPTSKSEGHRTYAYYSVEDGWIAWSPGPDKDYDLRLDNAQKLYDRPRKIDEAPELLNLLYDPTNGATSNGDIFWIAPVKE